MYSIGRIGGILLLWNSSFATVEVVGSIEQEIHVLIEVCNSNFSWLLSVIYASPKYFERLMLWNNLELVASACDFLWIVLGDFNEVLCDDEKLGGGPVNLN